MNIEGESQIRPSVAEMSNTAVNTAVTRATSRENILLNSSCSADELDAEDIVHPVMSGAFGSSRSLAHVSHGFMPMGPRHSDDARRLRAPSRDT
ncbi:hypothetical protein SSBR45G_60580 [Bradyrhizobium sp. SSBR45G]|nr:hypothetical protein SSBR45G_60580 [Bradyrhizobium sp. SSBR45G]